MNYGTKLREIRKNMGFTLEDVSRKTKFTKSFISQIENGKNSPSIASLKKICTSLNTTISELFKNERPDIHVLGNDDYNIIEYNNSVFTFMASQFSGSKLEPLIIEIQPNGEATSKSYQIKGEKFAYVVKGSVTLYMKNNEFLLKENDLVYFNSHSLYRFKNLSDHKAVVFCVGTSSVS